MCIGIKHDAADTAPHHQLDDTIGDTLFYHVGNSRMTENVGGDMLVDFCTVGNTFQLFLNRCMGERCLTLCDKNEIIPLSSKWIIISPLCEMFTGHDQPQISWFLGLEPDIDNNPKFIKFQVAPFKCPQLPDTETPLIEHHNDSSVDTPGTYLHHGRDLLRCKKISRGFGHGIFLRTPEFSDLALR